jgi:hypothetical protein
MTELTPGERLFRRALYAVIALLVIGTGLMVTIQSVGPAPSDSGASASLP